MKFEKSIPYYNDTNLFVAKTNNFKFEIKRIKNTTNYHVLISDELTLQFFNSLWKDIKFKNFNMAEKWCLEVLKYYKKKRIQKTINHREILNDFLKDNEGDSYEINQKI